MRINPSTVLEITGRSKVVAIVRLDDLSQAVPLSEALLAGGITALEFTLSNPAAISAMVEVQKALPHFVKGEAVIGIGTVLDVSAAKAAIEAGAQFLISPHTDFGVIEQAKKADIAVMPGALTPTEIMAAWQAGATAVKIFPARSFGANYVKDLREPMSFLKLIPTGGVNLENAHEFIKNGAVAVGVGGNLVDKQLVANQAWDELAAKASAFVQAVRGAK
jgi:2-dehydro-3-deoxyphosphogluconate aldolase / (4S)-4-hydroxy-2-oxoglutarate aldolase